MYVNPRQTPNRHIQPINSAGLGPDPAQPAGVETSLALRRQGLPCGDGPGLETCPVKLAAVAENRKNPHQNGRGTISPPVASDV